MNEVTCAVALASALCRGLSIRRRSLPTRPSADLSFFIDNPSNPTYFQPSRSYRQSHVFHAVRPTPIKEEK